MRTNHGRDIFFLDIKVEATPGHCPLKTMAVIGEYFGRLFKSPEAVAWTKNQKQKVYLRDFELTGDKEFIKILVYLGNGEAGGASFTNLRTDKHRNEDLEDGEGRSDTAHLIISTKSYGVGQHRYPALLESCPSLPRARVERYLNHLLRKAKKAFPGDFETPKLDGSRDKRGNPRTEKYNNRFSMIGHISKDFDAALTSGRLNGIALETYNRTKIGFGEERHVAARKLQLGLKPIREWRSDPLAALAEARSLGRKHKYEHVRVQFQTEDTMPHTAIMESETGHLLEDGFIKKKRITDFSIKLADGEEAFNTEIIDKMMDLWKE